MLSVTVKTRQRINVTRPINCLSVSECVHAGAPTVHLKHSPAAQVDEKDGYGPQSELQCVHDSAFAQAVPGPVLSLQSNAEMSHSDMSNSGLGAVTVIFRVTNASAYSQYTSVPS